MLPFVKMGALSALDTRTPGATLIYLDGVNSKGFSGGPILFWLKDEDGKWRMRVLGVVSGYPTEAHRVLEMKEEQADDTEADRELYVLANPGIVRGFGINSIVEAIEKHQAEGATAKPN